MYVQRAGAFKLLTGVEERQLATHVQELTSLKEIAATLSEELGREVRLALCLLPCGNA